MPKRRSQAMRRFFALVIVVLTAGVFAVRLVDLQIVSAQALEEAADGRRSVPVTIPSLRGDVVDRNGETLATTDERYDVQLSPKNTQLYGGRFPRQVTPGGYETVMVTSEEAFAEIGAITGQTAEEIQKIVDDALEENPDSDFAYVKRFVDLSTLNKLKALRIPWLTFESQFTRLYPNGAVAGNLVGFSDFEGSPQAGVEYSQDECLTGVDGEETYERSADGVRLPGSIVVTQEAEAGGTVRLSIDTDLQWQAQQAINEQTRNVSAEWGLLVILDTETGELLAVAEDGSVDPNDVGASDPLKREARSFVAPYEPGSTFKTITASALLEEGLATPHSPVETPDTWEPEPNVRFGDAFRHGIEPWTLTGTIVYSSNVGVSMLGSRLSEQQRYDYLRAFGIGESTHAGMPLEDSGLLYPPEQWDRQTSYNIMFGQGLSSTIVQTAGVYQTIANGGVRVPPRLVLGCDRGDGDPEMIDSGEPVRVVSEKTAGTMMSMLEEVVHESWVEDFVSIPGYRIAGKTGTAEQSDGQGYRSDYVSSFAGIFPAEDPKYVIVSSVAFPAAGDGGEAALRAFRAAAEATIRTYQIPPSSGSHEHLPTTF